MSAADPAVPAPTAAVRPARCGLAAKLFAILLLLGAVAVLVTGVLGYLRARDALEETIFNQLTAARETKARQVETYFRTHPQRAAPARRLQDGGRRHARLPRRRRRARRTGRCRPSCASKVGDWYDDDFLPEVRRAARQGHAGRRLPAGRLGALLPAVPLHRRQSASEGPAQAGRRCRRRQRLQQAARDLSSADARGGRDGFGFFDFMLADPKSGRLIYTVEKEVDFATSLRAGPYRTSNVAAAVARCAPARRPVGDLPGGFRPLRCRRAARPPPSWRRR